MYSKQFAIPLNFPGLVMIIVRALVNGDVVHVIAKPVQKAVLNTSPVRVRKDGSEGNESNQQDMPAVFTW